MPSPEHGSGYAAARVHHAYRRCDDHVAACRTRAAGRQGSKGRYGMVYPGPQAAVPPRVEAVLNGVRAAGYLAPAQVELVLRVTDGDNSRITPLVAEIIASNVDVILSIGAPAVQRFPPVWP